MRILYVLSNSMPQTVHFTAEATVDRSIPRGTVEIEHSTLLSRAKTDTAPLATHNTVRKGMFDTRFAIYVTAEQNTRIKLRSHHFLSRWLYLALGVVLALGIVTGLGGVLVRSVG